MTREEFYKSIGLMKNQAGNYFMPVPGENAREFVLYSYLRNPGDVKYLPDKKFIHGRIELTEQAILDANLKAFRNEFEATISDMYDVALKEFNGSLEGVISFETDRQPATLEFLIKCIEETKNERL